MKFFFEDISFQVQKSSMHFSCLHKFNRVEKRKSFKAKNIKNGRSDTSTHDCKLT